MAIVSCAVCGRKMMGEDAGREFCKVCTRLQWVAWTLIVGAIVAFIVVLVG